MGQGRKPTPEGLLLHEAASPAQPNPTTPRPGPEVPCDRRWCRHTAPPPPPPRPMNTGSASPAAPSIGVTPPPPLHKTDVWARPCALGYERDGARQKAQRNMAWGPFTAADGQCRRGGLSTTPTNGLPHPGRSLTRKKKCSVTQFSPKSRRAHHVLAVGGWRLAVGDWRLVAVGGGWWWAVDGPLGRSLRAVLNKKKI